MPSSDAQNVPDIVRRESLFHEQEYFLSMMSRVSNIPQGLLSSRIIEVLNRFPARAFESNNRRIR